VPRVLICKDLGDAHPALFKNSPGHGHKDGTPTLRPSGWFPDSRLLAHVDWVPDCRTHGKMPLIHAEGMVSGKITEFLCHGRLAGGTMPFMRRYSTI